MKKTLDHIAKGVKVSHPCYKKSILHYNCDVTIANVYTDPVMTTFRAGFNLSFRLTADLDNLVEKY